MKQTPHHFFVYKNGTAVEVPELQATILATTHLLCFESLRVYRGVIFRLEEHLRRLRESAHTSCFHIPCTDQVLRARLHAAVRASGLQEAFARITIIADDVWVFVMPKKQYPPETYTQGIAICTTPTRRNLSRAFYPRVKSSNFLNAILGLLDVHEAPFEQTLFLDDLERVTEGTTSNIFMVKHRTVFTPPAYGLLEGITRRFIMELAATAHLAVSEQVLTRHDLFNADEAFLTNTSGELLPIRMIDGRQIGQRMPGRITQLLHRAYTQQVTKEIRHAHYSASAH